MKINDNAFNILLDQTAWTRADRMETRGKPMIAGQIGAAGQQSRYAEQEKEENLNLQNVIIESERLVQKPITIKYAYIIFDCFNKNVTKYMYPKPADRIDETYQFINSAISGLRNGTNLQLVILKKENKEFIGCVGLHNVGKNDPELGIWIKESEHRHGYGLEAINSIIKWARQNIEFHYLKYPVDKRNVASRRIPEMNSGIIKKEYKKINMSNFELDEVEYWIYK